MVNTEIRSIIFFAAKDREALYSQQKQDQELTVAQIMNSLLPNSDWNWRKQGRPLDHSGITKIKSLMIIQWNDKYIQGITSDRVPEELWTEVRDIVQKCKKAKWLSEEALQIAEKRKEAKGTREKERYTHLNAEFQRIVWRDKKASLSDQCKEMEESNRMEKTSDLFKKIRDTKGTFHAKMDSIKDRHGMDQTEAEDIKKWQEYT